MGSFLNVEKNYSYWQTGFTPKENQIKTKKQTPLLQEKSSTNISIFLYQQIKKHTLFGVIYNSNIYVNDHLQILFHAEW